MLFTLKVFQCSFSKRFSKLFYSFLYENIKHITKFFKLFKKVNYRKKIPKHVERNIYKCTEVYNFA